MAEVTLPDTNAPISIVAAAGHGHIYCINGTAVLENAADPTLGIPLKQGESIEVDGWTAAWTAQSAIPGVEVLLRVAVEV